MSPRSLLRRAGLVLALCAASLLALPVAAGAQADPARVRVAHFSPDAPVVDIYVNDDKVLSGVEYKTVSDYLELPAGSYDLAVRPAGAAATSDPVVEATAEVAAGQAYTVAAVGALDDIALEIYGDDLSAPAAGKAKVRVIHAAPEVPAVDVAVEGGPTLFEGSSSRRPPTTPRSTPAPTRSRSRRPAPTTCCWRPPWRSRRAPSTRSRPWAGPARTSSCCRSSTPPASASRPPAGSPPALAEPPRHLDPRPEPGPGRGGRARPGRRRGQRAAAPACQRLTGGSPPGWCR